MKSIRSVIHFKLTLLFVFVLVIILFAITAGCSKGNGSDSNNIIGNIEKEDVVSEESKDIDSDSNAEKGDIQSDDLSETNDKFSEGEYVVGMDMPAGEYLLYKYEEEDQSSAPFIGVESSEGDYVSHLNFKNFVYYTVSEGQKVTLIDTYAIPVEEIMPYEPINNKYIEGMYKVGFDIPAGDYTIIFDADNRAYVAVYSDSKNIPDSITAEAFCETDYDISVKDGEYLRFTGAYIIAN